MQHRKLDALMSSIEKIARVAAAGVEQARAVQTEPSGAKSYDNADGTRTIIGNIANGESNPSFTMATHVGDTTAPGIPTGVTASSKSGVVVVEWDGTIDGGIPDDFFCVRIYLDGSELGVLREAGSVSSAKLEGGTVHSVTATAEDDACLPDGTPAHNVSAPTAAVSVTVSEGVESVAAIAQQALDVAEATGQHFWSDTDGIHVTEVTEDEWKDSTGSSYHSGMNVLINALGQLFRDGLNNLLSLGSSGLAIFDGQGNADSNIIANIRAAAAEFARQFDWKQASTGDVEFFGGLAGVHVESTPFTPEGGTAPTVVDMVTRVDGTLDLRDEGYGYASGELRVQQEVSQNGVPQAVASIEAASSKGTGNGYASLGVQSSSTGSSAISAAADTFVFHGSNGAIIDTATMLETVNSIRTASTTMNLSNVGSGTHTLSLYRQGHIVYASMTSAINPASANTAINAGTVPSGYRPAAFAMCSGAGMVSNTISNWFYRWRVAPTGAIVLHISVTGAREAPLVMSWYTNDAWPA